MGKLSSKDSECHSQLDNEKVLKNTPLKFYIVSAKKLIAKHASKFRLRLDIEMLSNEDTISNIAYLIMRGDENWDGRGTRHGFRKQCAIWGIQSYLGKKKKKMKRKIKTDPLSLNRKNSKNNRPDDEGKNLLKVLVDNKAGDPLDYVIGEERRQIMMELIDKLPKLDKKCIIMRFQDNKNLHEIADETGYSTESIRKRIKKNIHKLYFEYERRTS